MPSGYQANVVAGAPILSSWGNTIRDRSVMVFDTAAQRDTQLPAPTEGMVCYIIATKAVYVYTGTAWQLAAGGFTIRATRAAAFTTSGTANAASLFAFDSEVADPLNAYAAGRFTCPVAGAWLTVAQVSMNLPANAASNVRNRVNGVDVANVNMYNGGTATGAVVQTLSTVEIMAVGDYSEIWVSASVASATVRVSTNETRLSISYLGP